MNVNQKLKAEIDLLESQPDIEKYLEEQGFPILSDYPGNICIDCPTAKYLQARVDPRITCSFFEAHILDIPEVVACNFGPKLTEFVKRVTSGAR